MPNQNDVNQINALLGKVKQGDLIGFDIATKILWVLALSDSMYDTMDYLTKKVIVRNMNTLFCAIPIFLREASKQQFRFRYPDVATALIICFRHHPVNRRIIFDEIPDVIELVQMKDREAREVVTRYRVALMSNAGHEFVRRNPLVTTYYTDMCIAEMIGKSILAGDSVSGIWNLRRSLLAYDSTLNKTPPLSEPWCPNTQIEKMVTELDKEALLTIDQAIDISMAALAAPTTQDAKDLFEYLFRKLKKVDMVTINVSLSMIVVILHGSAPAEWNLEKNLPYLIGLMNTYPPFKHYTRSSEAVNANIIELAGKLGEATTFAEHAYLVQYPNARSYAVDRLLALSALHAYLDDNVGAMAYFMEKRERINNVRG